LGTVRLEDVLDVEGVHERLFGEDFHGVVDAVASSLSVKFSGIDEELSFTAFANFHWLLTL
jgi:hypothetical protein